MVKIANGQGRRTAELKVRACPCRLFEQNAGMATSRRAIISTRYHVCRGLGGKTHVAWRESGIVCYRGRTYQLRFVFQAAEEIVKFQLRHGNDLLAMDSLRACDVSQRLEED